jgi:hypothetical protein
VANKSSVPLTTGVAGSWRRVQSYMRAGGEARGQAGRLDRQAVLDGYDRVGQNLKLATESGVGGPLLQEQRLHQRLPGKAGGRG